MSTEKSTPIDNCSFCHKHKDQVKNLIIGENVAICNECINLCQDLIVENTPVENLDIDYSKIKDPRQLKGFLDDYVIGQMSAKMVLSVAVVNHYKRLQQDPEDEQAPVIEKSNVLFLGPTGSGKTLLARSVAQYLDVPFVIADATSITEAGYVGDDVESLIGRLYAASGYNIERCQKGIVFIDEIDKIAKKSENTSNSRDVSGEGVQQALLKLVEGTVAKVPVGGAKKQPGSELVEIDTSDILFIAAGAFVGLEKIIEKRTHVTSIGFNSVIIGTDSSSLDQVTSEDIVKFGMIPEFVGRFPTVVTLQELTRDEMIQILTQVRNNYVSQYQWLFKQDGIRLVFDRTAIDAIVDRSIEFGTGARALHGEVERSLMPHMYNMHNYIERNIHKISMTRELVETPQII